MDDLFYCRKCNTTKAADNFYLTYNTEKYPTGRLDQCKKCLTLHVDNWDPDTYLWILQEIDVPYVPDEWHNTLAKYGKDPSKVTGTTILGRYLSKMKLKQWKDYRWKDNDFIQELLNNKRKEAMQRNGYDTAQIAEAIDKATFSMPEKPLEIPEYADSSVSDLPVEDYFAEQSGAYHDDDLDLTDEDKTYLRLKWGKTYKPEEWVRLEQLYEEMMQSYDIQTAGHIDTLKLICKTSLKANQLLDIGDIDGAQKILRMYDSLMKSGKFTAAQNKAESGEYVDSVSELVAVCERDGFIPKYYIDEPKDKVDRVIQDLQDYTRSLITEEMHLGALIEKAVKTIEEDKLRELEEEIDGEDEDEAFERELFNPTQTQVSDQDFIDFEDFIDDEAKFDEDYLQTLLDSEDN